MEEHLLNECKLVMSLTDKDGKEIAKTDIPYAELGAFRKANGAPPSVLLENLLENLRNLALYGPDGKSEAKHNLPPRKPGGVDFNR